MAEPIRIRAAVKDGITEVRMLVAHPMESGHRRDSSGKAIPPHHVTELTARHKDKVVLSARMSGGISTNPYLSFRFQGGATGDTLTVTWVDNKGQTRSDEGKIA
jgi:sulfur-oxidizing protein SoxZ